MFKRMTVLALSFSTGCLSTSHVIPHDALVALANTPADARGNRVRVIQGNAGDDAPAAPRVETGAVIIVGGPVYEQPAPFVPVRSLAAAKADESKFWIFVAAVTAVSLAFTEGARYDGWVGLHPMHPVHLYMNGGGYRWVPLAQITPELAASSMKAMVREEEGPWHKLGRAPLNREGWSYSVFLGNGDLPLDDGSVKTGFQSHLQLGVFPTRMLGILFDLGLGWREDLMGDTAFVSRYAGELQFFPLALGPIHLGAFGQAGFADRTQDFVGESSTSLYAGGGLLQLALTTRLALTARVGFAHLLGEDVAELGGGLSIY